MWKNCIQLIVFCAMVHTIYIKLSIQGTHQTMKWFKCLRILKFKCKQQQNWILMRMLLLIFFLFNTFFLILQYFFEFNIIVMIFQWIFIFKSIYLHFVWLIFLLFFRWVPSRVWLSSIFFFNLQAKFLCEL